MYVRITYEKLVNIVKFCSKASQMGDTPQTQSVILTTDPDGLEVESLAYSMWGRAHSECEVVTAGQVAVDGKFLSEVVSSLPVALDSIVELADSGSELEIVAGGSTKRRTIKLVALGDYSGRPQWAGPTHVVAPDICEQIMLANKASADASKPKLAGVHLHPQGIIATDSYKFLIVDTKLDFEPITIPSIIIDKFPDPNSFGEGEIEMGSDNGKVLFRFGANHDFIGSTIVEAFPDPQLIRNMIPDATTPNFMEISTDHLKAVTEGFKPFSSGMSRVTLYPDASMTIIDQNGDVATDHLDVESCEIDRPICFGLSYLNEVKGMLKGEETCLFRFHASLPDERPFVVQKDNLTIGIMPMRLH